MTQKQNNYLGDLGDSTHSATEFFAILQQRLFDV